MTVLGGAGRTAEARFYTLCGSTDTLVLRYQVYTAEPFFHGCSQSISVTIGPEEVWSLRSTRYGSEFDSSPLNLYHSFEEMHISTVTDNSNHMPGFDDAVRMEFMGLDMVCLAAIVAIGLAAGPR
ncbi:hypothetical protein HJFPF1_11351 [Paramyrothecium foliicola]|nr:hypothetical protein HJFPF1_11351 [Paramyrothecium foliicola]